MVYRLDCLVLSVSAQCNQSISAQYNILPHSTLTLVFFLQLHNFFEQEQTHLFLLEGTPEDEDDYLRHMAELMLFAVASADLFRYRLAIRKC